MAPHQLHPETQRLLESEDGENGSRRKHTFRSFQKRIMGLTRFIIDPDFHSFQRNDGPPCKWLLATMLVGGVLVVLFVANRQPSAWTSETQRGILDAMTAEKGSKVPSGCRSTLVLMRHCEKVEAKDEGDELVEDADGHRHCSEVGFRRAKYIPTLFGDGQSAIWPLPSHLYAMKQSRPGAKHLNYREIETITPLRDKAGVSIDARFSAGDERALARDYFSRLASGDMCGGRVVVVNWKHSRIPIMAAAVGCGTDERCPEKYSKNEFDKVWQIQFSYGSEGKSRTLGKHNSEPKEEQWRIKGSVINEGFEP